MSLFRKSSAGFRQTIEHMGYPKSTVDAVWPEWWSAEAESSRAAQAELRFTVARRLGLRPTTLFNDDAPEFVWKHEAKFKGLSAYDEREQSTLTSFGQALSHILMPAVPAPPHGYSLTGLAAGPLRAALLNERPYIGLLDLCRICWGLGVPILHLRVFPLPAKRMAAMAVRAGDRYAILVARDASYPAPTAFQIAHEMAHIALGHLDDTGVIVDTEVLQKPGNDREEVDADCYALMLLTGQEQPVIEMNAPARSGRQLASAAFQATMGKDNRIEAGTLCLCYGYQTGDWKVANAALHHVYPHKHDVWKVLNRTAADQLRWDALSTNSHSYVRAVLGAHDLA